jgi:hypothetical protein
MNSETLQNIDRQFAQLVEYFHLFFFHEAKPTDLKGTLRFVRHPIPLQQAHVLICNRLSKRTRPPQHYQTLREPESKLTTLIFANLTTRTRLGLIWWLTVSNDTLKMHQRRSKVVGGRNRRSVKLKGFGKRKSYFQALLVRFLP